MFDTQQLFAIDEETTKNDMAEHFYPGVLYPTDADGLFGVFVPNVNVMASGSSADEALADSAEILQEYCDNLADKWEVPEPPAQIGDIELDGGQIVMLPVLMTAEQARLNIMMDATLVRRIDAVAPIHRAFADLKPREIIDVQSLIWVVGEYLDGRDSPQE